MTVAADTSQRRSPVDGRRRPLSLHVAALALVLLALVPFVGTRASLSADEGAAIVQAKSLAAGDGWIVEHPAPELDPTGRNYPLENSDRGARGVAPYAKHPLYPVVLAAAGRAGGVTAMVLLSLAGTVAAAALAGLLARHIDADLDRPVLWIVGLGSPLLFDGFLVIGHAVAAALATGAVLLAVVAIERRSTAAALAVAPVVAAGTMLRTEFVFLALALAAAAFVVGMAARRPTIVVPVAALAGLAAARAVEGWWTDRILGGPEAGAVVATSTLRSAGVGGRWRGFVLTWLTPGYGAGGVVNLALVLMLVAVLLAAYTVRRRPGEQRTIVGLCVTAAACAAVALVAAPSNIVPGLLVAFPLAGAGLLLLRRNVVETVAARLSLATVALFAAGVLATQYERGGSGEWGGRYFALGVAVATPVLVLAVREGGRRLDASARQVVAVALAAGMVALSLMAVFSLRTAHRRNASMDDAVAAAVAATPAGDGGPAVVVAADGNLARHGWPAFDDARWLLAGSDLPALTGRLRAAGIPQFVYVTRDPTGPGAGLTVLSRADGGGAGIQWHVLVVRAT